MAEEWTENPEAAKPNGPRPQPVAILRDERLVAAISHLAIVAVVPAVVVPLLIWLFEKDKAARSEFVVFHAKQAMIYQVLALSVLTVLSATVVLLPLAIVAGVAAWVYGMAAAFLTWIGRDFKYLWIGDFARN